MAQYKKNNTVLRVPKGQTAKSTAQIEKLPYTGGSVTPTPLSKNTSSAKKATSGGVGAVITATNRKTGQKTTTKSTLTPISKSEFNGTAYKKTAARKAPAKGGGVSGITKTARKKEFSVR